MENFIFWGLTIGQKQKIEISSFQFYKRIHKVSFTNQSCGAVQNK